MAGIAGDFYFATVSGNYLGQEWVNRFWYMLDATESADSVAEVLVTSLFDNYSDLFVDLASLCHLTEIEAFKWSEPSSDFFIYTGDVVGGDALSGVQPSFVSLTFRSPKGFPGQRYGYKHITGLTDASVEGNESPSNGVFNAFGVFLGGYIPTTSAQLVPMLVISTSIPPINTGVQPNFTRNLVGSWSYRLGTMLSRRKGVGS